MNPLGQHKGRLSGLGIILRPRLPLRISVWRVALVAVFVPDYGNGWHATEFHRFSYYPGFF
jgi:hypothetical protein